MKKYWKSLEELKDIQVGSEVEKQPEPEFSVEGLSEKEVSSKLLANRRDFLKMLGFSLGYATLASSCEQPVRKAIPYLNKPEEVTMGMANHYASTYFDGDDYCPVVVKVRDGRPIKIEGNELSTITEGGTSARVQASVLSLYDSARPQHPLKNGEKSDWNTVDSEIKSKLEDITSRGERIVILSSSVMSPSTLSVFEDFKAKFPTTEVVYYDPVSYSAIRMANEKTFGRSVLPIYHFDLAEVIVGFNCDFLGTWLSPVEFANQYAKNRELTDEKKTMSRHYHFESYMSLTGSNADKRYTIKPSEELTVLLNLYNVIAAKSDMPQFQAGKSPVNVDNIAEDLLNNQTKSLVVSGTNDIYIQALVNAINFLLGNLGATFSFQKALKTKSGDDEQFVRFVDEMVAGQIGALLLYNVNPAYNYNEAQKFSDGLKNTGLTIALTAHNDETAALCGYVCPDHHWLESWNDAEPYNNLFSFTQPTIHPLFDTRQVQESLLTWAGIETDYHTYVKKYWEENIYPKQNEYSSFNDFWNHTLQKGVFSIETPATQCPLYDFEFLGTHASDLVPSKAGGIELVIYEKVGIGSGRQANNPWLQELPDPISKAVWDNYLALSPTWAKEQGLEQEDVVRISDQIELPVLLQPGQPYGTGSIAMGYGRTHAGKVGNGIGKNAFVFGLLKNGSKQFNIGSGTIEKTGNTYPLATTQTHHSMEGRPLVRETVLEKWLENPAAGNALHKFTEEKSVSLYKKPHFDGFHWGLGIDLNKCIGCSACVTACQAENNVAVIGKEQVKNRRIMHWIRVDRYYSSATPETPDNSLSHEPEPDNPEVVHQVVMCQHCDNAPCENVCPVAATTHSDEGLNQMAYNRCIGTRYCMNNCPYRVRRFNWFRYVTNDKFDYNFNDDLSRMVLNPDVVVRERGVVEKCSFCIQRIQEKKLKAKDENRLLRDGEIQTACVQACPTKALVFGDMSDPESKISKVMENPRMYNLLEQLHTLPSVGFLTKVRNKEQEENTDTPEQES